MQAAGQPVLGEALARCRLPYGQSETLSPSACRARGIDAATEESTMPVDLATLRVRPRTVASGRQFPSPISDLHAGFLRRADELLAEPFTGVTADGTIEPGLFPIQPTGVS